MITKLALPVGIPTSLTIWPSHGNGIKMAPSPILKLPNSIAGTYMPLGLEEGGALNSIHTRDNNSNIYS